MPGGKVLHMTNLSANAITALIDLGTSRQGVTLPAVVRGGEVTLAELAKAGLIGPERGLTRRGGIIRDREVEKALESAF